MINQYFVIISKSKLQLPFGHVHPIICEYKILHLRFYEPHDKSDDEYQEIWQIYKIYEPQEKDFTEPHNKSDEYQEIW